MQQARQSVVRVVAAALLSVGVVAVDRAAVAGHMEVVVAAGAMGVVEAVALLAAVARWGPGAMAWG